jgi:hypothetical protein
MSIPSTTGAVEHRGQRAIKSNFVFRTKRANRVRDATVKASATDVAVEAVGARKVVASANVTLGTLDQIMLVRVDFVGGLPRHVRSMSITRVQDCS